MTGKMPKQDKHFAKLMRMVQEFNDEMRESWLAHYNDTISPNDISGNNDREIKAMILRFTIRRALEDYYQLYNPYNPTGPNIDTKPLSILLEQIKTQITLLNNGTVHFIE